MKDRKLNKKNLLWGIAILLFIAGFILVIAGHAINRDIVSYVGIGLLMPLTIGLFVSVIKDIIKSVYNEIFPKCNNNK